jgi:hypothetical protein
MAPFDNLIEQVSICLRIQPFVKKGVDLEKGSLAENSPIFMQRDPPQEIGTPSHHLKEGIDFPAGVTEGIQTIGQLDPEFPLMDP